MSRCFPFPPPGYETTRTVDEARIQSMKLLKEKEIAKKERKKQKRHEKKEKRKAKKSIEIEHKKHGHKRRRKDEGCQEYEKRRSNEKMEENGAQQFVKSSLTEERRHPINFENLSDSTESTHNSSQRQKQSSSPEGAHDAGSVIRIRLPLQKNKNSRCSSETNPFTAQQTCSAFGIDSSIPEQCEMSVRAKAGSENSGSSTPLVSYREVSLQHSENGIHVTSEALKSCTEVPNNDPWPPNLEMRNLLNVIAPPSVHLVGLEDQEWLYEGKSKKSFKGETCSDEVSFRGKDMWPKGCYLPDADVYPLPFSVPF